ncbi:ATP-binding protein [Calothrix rhizosoleniae]|uniref:ATP-binding protein n=1 Tax=Calothrix rhizosoleniae TaxID=888997 RepID=UPI000B497EAD|nr:anti-sigma regulatory factor [Calothrix rhizosoleniae]
MITISLRPIGRNWGTISFASTLYLCPILDLLLAEIPSRMQAELRLGLQEALVNAAKHGNNLDPGKTVIVRFSLIDDRYWWIISDQGRGFHPACSCDTNPTEYLPPDESESGRGLCILHQIFDQVEWNRKGTELRLSKQLENRPRIPLLSRN